jgi:UDP-N-acetylmuramyl-tripeptide synthetase/UDP-N-acetylmuramoyl-tripeptide--D-alanyl-D-alanine ligase
MKLYELLDDALKACDAQIKVENKNAVVAGITDNTADVQPGFIFVCVKGTKFDGHTAAKDMLDKGAVCVVTEYDLKIDNQVITADSRKFYGLLCAAWFGHPEKKLNLVGVTGTNGKTTMTTLIKEILSESGHKVGFIGTTGAEINGTPVKTDESTPTTPRVYELYKLFKQMADSGCDSVVMEVSSFALEQNRIGPAKYKAAVFTNLTQDHLDYHGTMENYYQAKKKLFTEHCDIAIINKQDQYGARLYSEISCEKYTYAVKEKASVFGDNIKVSGGVTKFWFSTHEKSYPVTINMIGEYNVGNAVAAIAVCTKLGVSMDKITKALQNCKGVKGRCEVIPTGRDFMVICDYAHSPDALENMLPNIKAHTKGRLICLFGCGGDRDRTKRPLMAKAAEKYADYLIVTSDNPRNEDPDAIIDEIVAGLGNSKPFDRITDRRQAIFHAVKIAQKDDVIVLAGKGHEDYQILAGNVHIHFDEREIVAEALKENMPAAAESRIRERLSLYDIISAMDGKAHLIPDTQLYTYVDAISSDTRIITNGSIFFAIKGERFDGHDFVKNAIEAGAVVAVTERIVEGCPCIIVKNTRKALRDLASYYRMKFNPILVGITGSVGKTTTKEMTALALSGSYKTLKTEGNHNNEIGLPFTLFGLNRSYSAAVIEMGMSDFGEIEILSKTAHPTVCVITNIGFSHIEKLGSQEGILKAKLEILAGAAPDAPLIVNADDKLLFPLKEQYLYKRKVITYGIDNELADFRAVNITENDTDTSFEVVYNGKAIQKFTIPCIGRHNVLNAVCAAAVAYICDADMPSAANALLNFKTDPLRQHIENRGDQKLLIDCYNASPTSVEAAIDLLCSMKPENGGRRVAVLGDMLELGSKSPELHERIGEYAVKKGVDLIVCYGEYAKYIAKRADELGMHCGCSNDKSMVVNYLKFKLKPDDIVLFKASRGMHLEEIIKELYK